MRTQQRAIQSLESSRSPKARCADLAIETFQGARPLRPAVTGKHRNKPTLHTGTWGGWEWAHHRTPIQTGAQSWMELLAPQPRASRAKRNSGPFRRDPALRQTGHWGWIEEASGTCWETELLGVPARAEISPYSTVQNKMARTPLKATVSKPHQLPMQAGWGWMEEGSQFTTGANVSQERLKEVYR